MNSKKEIVRTMKQLDVKSIKVDRSYQRDLRNSYLRIASEFDPRLLGAISVSNRGTGAKPDYYVIDGQHRLAALTELGITTVDAIVYSGLSVEDEARMFSMQDRKRTKISSYDLYVAGKNLQGTPYHTLAAICDEVGLQVYSGRTNRGNSHHSVPALPNCIGVYLNIIEKIGRKAIVDIFTIYTKTKHKHNHNLYNSRLCRSLLELLVLNNTVDQLVDALDSFATIEDLIKDAQRNCQTISVNPAAFSNVLSKRIKAGK